jgi:hypothetical protein
LPIESWTAWFLASLGHQGSFAAMGGTLHRKVHHLLRSLILGTRQLRFGTQLQISTGFFILVWDFVHLLHQRLSWVECLRLSRCLHHLLLLLFLFMPNKPIGVRWSWFIWVEPILLLALPWVTYLIDEVLAEDVLAGVICFLIELFDFVYLVLFLDDGIV